MKNILMVGVGGQGIILASNITCQVLMELGYDVKKSEIHGMAQRGGSVVSHVRFGEKVYSPVIPNAEADIIVSFEGMEFLRYLNFQNKGTKLILNNRQILPPSVAGGSVLYPIALIEDVKSKFAAAIEIDADSIAMSAGNVKAASMPLLGELAKMLGTPIDIWEDVIRRSVPQKTVDVNLRAFTR